MARESRTFRYDTELTWRGGRSCEVTAGDRPTVLVVPPAEFPGGEDADWSPEHLFLASLQSCTMLSFLAHCAHNGVEVVDYRSQASGDLSRREEDRRYAFQRIALIINVVVAGGHAPLAQSLTDKAHRDCFITASTTAEVEAGWRITE